MKILLLGASGQLGKEWQFFLKKKELNNVQLLPFNSQQLDITKYQSVTYEIETHEPALIINCAAYTKVDRAEQEQERARKVNAEAVAHLAHLCRKHDITLVHYSTDYIFAGAEEDRERFPYGYPEGHSAEPINWYGKTKWLGEEAIRNSDCRHLIIRTCWLCGRYGNNFVKTMLRLGKERDELDIVNDQWGSPTFADEVVTNCYALMKANAEGTYHITSAGLTNWAEFAREIFTLADIQVSIKTVPSEEYPTVAERPRYSKLDTRKADGVSGVEISDWQEGLKRLLNDLRNE